MGDLFKSQILKSIYSRPQLRVANRRLGDRGNGAAVWIYFRNRETPNIGLDIPDLSQASFGKDTLERYDKLIYESLYIGHHPYLGGDVCNFLDCASFARATMSCSYNTTIGFFDKLVLRVYHEGRIICRKTMPLHRG